MIKTRTLQPGAQSALTSHFAYLFLFICLAFADAHAEDIDTYRNSIRGRSPNIMLMLDNSGSMHSSDTNASANYNPAQNYSGPFDRSIIYWNTAGRRPSNPGTSSQITYRELACAAAVTRIGEKGVFTDRLAERDNAAEFSRWSRLKSAGGRRRIECRLDNGTHGDRDGDGAPYPSNNNQGPAWVAQASLGYDWDKAYSYSLFSGNYLNYRLNPPASPGNRLSTVKQVATDLLSMMSDMNIGIGLFGTGTSARGLINTALLDVDDSRTTLLTSINNLKAETATPLADTLLEIGRYYHGLSASSTGQRYSAPQTMRSGRYASPLASECAANSALVITDGLPARDNQELSAMSSLYGIPNNCASGGNGSCFDEVASALNRARNVTLKDGRSATAQPISTFTVGFQLDNVLLKQTAQNGNGSYHSANERDELEEALFGIVSEVDTQARSLAAPRIPIDPTTQRTSGQHALLPVFRPDNSNAWRGNIKHLRVVTDELGTPTLRDRDNRIALDENGSLRPDARTLWGTGTDGNDALSGGFAERLSDAVINGKRRRLWSSLSGTSSGQWLDESNGNIVASIAQWMTQNQIDGDAQEYTRWLRGVDVHDDDNDDDDSDANHYVGALLHNQPGLLYYARSQVQVNNAQPPKGVIFAATTMGLMHAIDLDTGDEIMGFLPEQMLANAYAHYDANFQGTMAYGLDGPLTLAHQDTNNNGVVDNTEKAYLYFGMRRGGRDYYALDISQVPRTNMSLKWSTQGRGGALSLREQSWSKAQMVRVMLNNQATDLLLISGGYDPQADQGNNATYRGNALYLLNPLTGQVVWWAGNPTGAQVGTSGSPSLRLNGMNYSIAATPTVIDSSGNGLLDTIIVADIASNLWRIDFNTSNRGARDLARGGKIFDGKRDSPAVQQRKTYAQADVAIGIRSGAAELDIVFGTGDRANPLSLDDQNAVFMVRQPIAPPATYVRIDASDLFNSVQNDTSTLANQTAAQNNPYGWRLPLSATEKVFSRPSIVNGRVLFSSYLPDDGKSNDCKGSLGDSRHYLINLADASPATDRDGNGTYQATDRYTQYVDTGIAAETSIISTLSAKTGANLTDPVTGTNLSYENGGILRSYWSEQVGIE